MPYILSGREIGFCGPVLFPSVTLVTILSHLGELRLSTRKADILLHVRSIPEVPGGHQKIQWDHRLLPVDNGRVWKGTRPVWTCESQTGLALDLLRLPWGSGTVSVIRIVAATKEQARNKLPKHPRRYLP